MLGHIIYNQSKFSGFHIPPEERPSMADTVSAATAEIAENPNLPAALAAAITSMMVGKNQQQQQTLEGNARDKMTDPDNFDPN